MGVGKDVCCVHRLRLVFKHERVLALVFFRAGLVVYLCKQFCVCVSFWILFVKRECVFWCSVSFCFLQLCLFCVICGR